MQVGLFAASPDHISGGSSGDGGPSIATGVFDHVALRGGQAGAAWHGTAVGGTSGSAGSGYRVASESSGAFTVTGSGDIAPAVVGGGSDPGRGIERTLIGAFVGLIVLVVVAALFITGEYRRGLIRTTFAASPRRGACSPPRLW